VAILAHGDLDQPFVYFAVSAKQDMLARVVQSNPAMNL
jgi:hypothetical protein